MEGLAGRWRLSLEEVDFYLFEKFESKTARPQEKIKNWERECFPLVQSEK